MSFGMGANFNEPKSNDPTSAPPETDPKAVQVASPKKKKGFRDPGPLARAIAQSKRAKQGNHKYG